MTVEPKGIRIVKNQQASQEGDEKWNVFVDPELLPILTDSDWAIDEDTEWRVCGYEVKDEEGYQAAAADTRCGRGR